MSNTGMIFQQPYMRIIQQLIASDTGALSLKEIQFRHNNDECENIQENLDQLEEEGHIQTISDEGNTENKDLPVIFYTPTQSTIETLKDTGLWDVQALIFQIYNKLERTEELTKIENMENRPVPDWANK